MAAEPGAASGEAFASRSHGGHRISGLNARVGRSGMLFFLPFAVLFGLTVVLPLLYAVYLSGFEDRFIGGRLFVGMANYVRTLTDPALFAGLARVTAFMLLQIPVMLGLALVASMAIDSGRLFFPTLFRLGMFIPYAVPSVVAALMWGYLYGNKFGLIGQLASALHLPAPDLFSKTLMIPAIANISIWQFTGYNMLIFYAALQSISREILEAAQIDGAGSFRIAWSIKLPALRPAVLLTGFFSVIGGVQLFTEPSVLQGLAPTTIVSDYTPALYTYTLAVKTNQYEYAAAVSLTMGALTILAVILVQTLARRSRRAAG